MEILRILTGGLVTLGTTEHPAHGEPDWGAGEGAERRSRAEHQTKAIVEAFLADWHRDCFCVCPPNGGNHERPRLDFTATPVPPAKKE